MKRGFNKYTTYSFLAGAAAGIGAAAAAASAGVSIAQAAGAFGEEGGGGDGAGGGMTPGYYRPEYKQDYENKKKRFDKFWKTIFPKLKKTQQKQLQRVIELQERLYGRGKEVYSELEQEKVYRIYRDEINTLTNSFRDIEGQPGFEKRVNEKERGINKRFQSAFQDVLDTHAHAVAKGDIGIMTGERSEQAFLHSLASKRDEAGTQARKESRDEVTEELKNVLAGKTNLLSTYKDVAHGERARTEADFNLWSNTEIQKNQAQSAMEDFINQLLISRQGGTPQKPDEFDIMNRYWVPPSTAGQSVAPTNSDRAGAAAGSIAELLKNKDIESILNSIARGGGGSGGGSGGPFHSGSLGDSGSWYTGGG